MSDPFVLNKINETLSIEHLVFLLFDQEVETDVTKFSFFKILKFIF